MGRYSYNGINDVEKILEMSFNNNYFTYENFGIESKTDAKVIILNKLYELAAKKLYKLESSFNEIDSTHGDVSKYKAWDMICETANALESNLKIPMSKDNELSSYVKLIRNAITNVMNNKKAFMDAYTYNSDIIKHIYITTIASIIFAESYLIVVAIDYERKNEKVGFGDLINNISKLNHGIPKFMIDYLEKFNDMAAKGEISKMVNVVKNSHEAFVAPLMIIGSFVGVLFIIIPLLRWIIYYFNNLKISISEFLELQASYLEYNINKLRRQHSDERIILKQMKAYEFLKKTSAKLRGEEYIEKFNVRLSKEKYEAEKKTEEEIKEENNQLSKSDNNMSDQNSENDIPDNKTETNTDVVLVL